LDFYLWTWFIGERDNCHAYYLALDDMQVDPSTAAIEAFRSKYLFEPDEDCPKLPVVYLSGPSLIVLDFCLGNAWIIAVGDDVEPADVDSDALPFDSKHIAALFGWQEDDAVVSSVMRMEWISVSPAVSYGGGRH